jgi:hypothetical protein
MTRNEIENTAAFQSLPEYKKNIYKSGKNIKILCEQYLIAKNSSYEEWYNSFKPSDAENKIIKELLKA